MARVNRAIEPSRHIDPLQVRRVPSPVKKYVSIWAWRYAMKLERWRKEEKEGEERKSTYDDLCVAYREMRHEEREHFGSLPPKKRFCHLNARRVE